MRTLALLLLVLFATFASAGHAHAQQGTQQPRAQQVYGVHIEGTLIRMQPNMKVEEERQYILERVCYPEEQRFTEHFRSWVGEDTDSLVEWEQEFKLDGNAFKLLREGISEGSGSLEGRPWSWDEIRYSYREDGLLYKCEGDYSGRKCQRAIVATDANDNVVWLISDKSNVITEEEYAIMMAIYERIEMGYR